MQSEIRSNGRLQIRLMGNWPIEKQAIEEMLEAAGKGRTVQVLSDMDPQTKQWILILSLDKV